jgi:hypothetical protein
MDEIPVPYQLAYEASVHGLTDQASVLESLRSRAGTVFAATALVTSFLGVLLPERRRQAVISSLLFWSFRVAIVCLVAEVAAWIAVLEDLG